MSLRLRLVSWLTSPLLLTLIPSLLPIPSYLFSSTAQAQTSQDWTIEADKLLEQGIQQFDISEYQAAIRSWQQTLAIYQQLKDRDGEASSLNNLGLAYYSLGQYPKAIEFHQQSLAIKQEIGDRNGEALSLMNMGIAYSELGQYPKAIDPEYSTQSAVNERFADGLVAHYGTHYVQRGCSDIAKDDTEGNQKASTGDLVNIRVAHL